MSFQLIACLVIFALTVISFIWGKVSMAVTALFALVALVLTGCIDVTTALSGFANSNTIIMASMFVVSAGFSKTQMVAKLSRSVAKAGGNSFTRIMIGYILVTALIAQFVPSAMAVFSIVFPLALGVCRELKVNPSKMIFSLGIVAIATVCTLPIGAGAAYPAQFNGIMEQLGIVDYSFKFWDVCIARLPAMVFMLVYAIFLAPKFTPDNEFDDSKNIFAAKSQNADGSAAPQLKPAQEVVGYVVFFGVVLGIIVTSMQLLKVNGNKIDTCIFPLLGAVIMVASGILKPKDAYNSIGMGGMVLMYVGVLALASALSATGAGELIGNGIASIFGANANRYVVGLVFFLVPFILTQFMMNWAVLNIFCPIAILTCAAIGMNPLGPTVLVVIGSLTAWMTPMATPSAAMMMGLGGYDQKTMFKMSWLPAVCMCVINVLWVMSIFR